VCPKVLERERERYIDVVLVYADTCCCVRVELNSSLCSDAETFSCARANP